MQRCKALIVEDHEDYSRFLRLILQRETQCQVISEASDGLEAVQKAGELQPELILLDIGLPRLNGIEAAKRIRMVAPNSRIMFVSQNSESDIVEAVFGIGALGYLLKSDAAQLPTAVEAVLKGKQFVSAGLTLHASIDPRDERPADYARHAEFVGHSRTQNVEVNRHEIEFYADEPGFVDGFARFVESGLKAGNAVVVIATESHHVSLLQRLVADGVNVDAEIEQRSYIPFDVADTLSRFMVNELPDPVLFTRVAGDLITEASKGAKGECRRVAVCGEAVHILLATGNSDATITLERLWNEIARGYELDILCGYFGNAFTTYANISMLETICAEHSAAHGRERCY